MKARDSGKEERSAAGIDSPTPLWCSGKMFRGEEFVEGAPDPVNGTIQQLEMRFARF